MYILDIKLYLGRKGRSFRTFPNDRGDSTSKEETLLSDIGDELYVPI